MKEEEGGGIFIESLLFPTYEHSSIVLFPLYRARAGGMKYQESPTNFLLRLLILVTQISGHVFKYFGFPFKYESLLANFEPSFRF